MSILGKAAVDQFDLPHPGGQGTLQISVAPIRDLPADKTNLPIIFVVDADLMFPVAAEIARLRYAGGAGHPAIIVGIGYGAATFADFAKLRTADLSPPLSAAGRANLGAMAEVIGREDGGADAFLTFLVEVLTPEIIRRYPETANGPRSLFGHSLGGLFVAYALLTRPQAFDAFFSSSPSLWWDGFAVLRLLPEFKRRLTLLDRHPTVLVAVGGQEQDLPTKVPAQLPMALDEVQALVRQSRMVDGAAEFASALRENGVTNLRHVVFQDESHGSVVPAALMRAMTIVAPEDV